MDATRERMMGMYCGFILGGVVMGIIGFAAGVMFAVVSKW